MYERVVLRRGRNHDPELDSQAKIDELRSLYERVNDGKGVESEEGSGESVSDKVSTYFEWEKTKKAVEM